jgi:hypothetical protein
MESREQTPDRNVVNRSNGNVTNNIDRETSATEAPQMRVMGRAGGSRTTSGGEEPNTTLSSRPEPSLGAMGNAAGFPPSNVSGIDDDMNSPQQGGNTFAAAMMNDVADLVRRYPLPSMLIGLGLGYLFSRRSSRQGWLS